jgi:hypothetical protein
MPPVIHTWRAPLPVDASRSPSRNPFSANGSMGIHSSAKPCSMGWVEDTAVFQGFHSTSTTTTFFFSLV